VQLGLINSARKSNKFGVAQQRDRSKNPKKKHHRHKKNKARVPNPLPHHFLLMVKKEKNPKTRRLKNISIFLDKMVMWSSNVLSKWNL
jgi:type VI protein secretion system component VasA